MVLSFFRQRAEDLKAAAQRFNDKETAEAVVAIMAGVAFADGELEETERKKMAAAFGTHPLLSQFDMSMLTTKFNELSAQFSLDVDIGHDACIKELKDVGSRAGMDKRVTILRLGVVSAKADGEIEPQERAFLVRCAQTLGVELAEVGL